ncbi:MAG: YDG domain-containing protein [Roseateles sp.]
MNLSTAGNTSTAADIKINGAIDTHLTGGNVTVTAQRHVLQAADVLAGAGDVNLSASTGSISRTAGTVGGNDVVLSAATTIGSSSQFINTSADTLKLSSAGDQFVSEADGVTLAAATTSNGALVVNAGATLTVGSASGLTGISTGSGEINLKAASLALNANASTTGNAFLEATGSMSANGSGLLSANQAVLSAGAHMGSSTQRVLTAVNRLALNANGDSATTAFISESNGLTLSAKALLGGAIDVQNTTGTLSLGNFSLSPSWSGNAAGYAAPASAQTGIESKGSVTLQALAGQVEVAKDLQAAGTVHVQGKTAEGSTAVLLRSGTSIINLAAAGESTTLWAEQGNIAADGPASLSAGDAGKNSGVIQLLAGSNASSAGAVDGTNLTITQNGNGTVQGNNGKVGVLVQTSGQGHVTAPKIINQGSGNVVLAAGAALAAGNAGGGQVKTVGANTTAQQGGGKTYVYTGAAASSGDLKIIDSGFSTLYLSPVDGNRANAKTNTDFASGPQQNSGTNSQVMARERLSFSDKINSAQLRITYGDADPTAGAVKEALKAANTVNGSSIVETVAAGSNSYQVTRAAIIDDLSIIDPAAHGSPRHAGTVANGFAAGYDYGLSGNNFEVNTATGTAKLFVDPKLLTLRATKVYDGSTDMTGYVDISGLVDGQTLNYSGATANGKNVSAGVKASFINAIRLADGAGANAGLASDYVLPDLTQASGNNQASVTARTVTLNASKTYDGKTSLSGTQLTLGNLVAGETLGYQDAQLNSKNVWEADHVSALTLLDGAGGGLASNYATPDLSQRVAGVNEAQVSKARLSVTITGEARKVYDGGTEAQLKASNFLLSGLADGDSGTLGFADPAQAITGTYASKNVRDNTPASKGRVSATVDNSLVQLTQGDARNYDLPTGDASGMVGVITPKAASVSGVATSKMFNGQDQSQDPALLTGFVEADLSAGRVLVSGVATGRNASRYTSQLSVSGDDASNYEVSIQNADLTISKNNVARVMLTAKSATTTYNGSTQSVSGFTAEGLVGADTVDNIGAQAGASGRNAGVYGTAFSNTDQLQANYENVELKNGALTINKNSTARVMLTAYSDSKQYNGTTHSVSGFTAEGLVGADTADNIGAQAGASGRNAGVYGTAFSNTDQVQANYENVDLKNGALTINKNRTTRVVLTANSDNKQYNGATQSVSGFTADGLVGGDTVDNIGAQAGASGRNAGVYGTAFSNTDLVQANYENVELKNGALTINKNSTTRVVLIANSDTKQYNGVTQSVSGFTADGLVGGDTSDNIGAQAGASGRNAGVYGTAFSNTDQVQANYENVEFKNGALTISKNTTARVVLTANSAATEYNGASQSVSGFSVAGLLADDAADVVKATSGISAGASGKNAGRYITAFAGSNADLENNYANIDKVDGALTINKNSTTRVVLTANSASTEYNGATQLVSGFTVAGLVGEDAANAGQAAKGISASANGKIAGRYTTAFSGSNVELERNYASIDKVDGALTINKNSSARVVLTANGATAEYNGATQTVSGFSATGLVGDDTADSLGVSSWAQGKSAGRYGTAFQGTEQLRANYANVELRDAALVIDPKPVTLINITAADKVYDGSVAASITQASVLGTVNGETLQVAGDAQFEDKNVGQGKLVSMANPQNLRLLNGSGEWRNYRLQASAALTTRANITPKLLTVVGSTAQDKVFDGNTRAVVSAGNLQGLVGVETLVVASLSGQFRDAAVGTGKPVDVSYGLANGLNGGLASNYRLVGSTLAASITTGNRRPDDPKPIPPNDRDPSRIISAAATGAGVPNLCNEQQLDDADATQSALTEEKLSQCSCDLTEVNGVFLCYTPRAAESDKKEKRS